MSDFILRPACEKDTQQIIRIWRSAFGDSEAFIRELIERSALLENAVCAEVDGAVRSCMFAFDGLCVSGKKAAYIYALCTEPAYRSRGLGRAVTGYAAEMARARGAELVFLLPANAGLEKWYTEALGARAFARASVEKVSPAAKAEIKAVTISPEEYLLRRSDSPWSLSLPLILAEEAVHRHYGGAFLACGDTVICVENGACGTLVREISGMDSDSALAAAAEYFGTNELSIIRGGKAGSTLMLLPPFSPEGLCGIPFMPFTLD